MSKTANKTKNKEKGISIIEVLLAVAVFIIGVATITLMYVNSVIGSFNSLEETRAMFLAQEGLEAVKSIRDNDFGSLFAGTHGLALFEGKWILSGESEEVLGFTRTITIAGGALGNFIVKSRVSWQDPFLKRERTVELVESVSNIYSAL